ncbi:histidine kinase [Amorphoplanes digitatis]|uniref:histidine kinase n=1 Tax=Actinoplanes digitatis TaxID=1868 RepID=A0A7W7MU83_9ACTN|nr:nitrate- and nitrite sensing domain-containing protein [Actinoplanes digitatis]MBB4766505.1 signal transduction histidine kinase [Actinoplanes digitatis]GID98100.1 histidine kinase [Actinoplanes digitatis]
MSTGSSAQASTYPAGGTELPPGSGADAGRSSGFGTRERRGRIPRLRDARIRSKLALILFVPLLAVLALATVRLVDVGGRALDARQVEDLTRLSTDISRLTQYLHKERMAAAQYLADPAAKPDGFNAAIEQSDARIQEYTADRAELDEPPAAVADRLTRIDDHLQTMDATRTKITDRDEIAISEAVLRYSVVITDLVGYGEVLSQYAGEGTVADSLRAVSAFARAKAGTAEQEAVAYAARASGDLSAEQLSVFTATQTSQQEALEGFALVATPAQRSLVDNTVTGDAVNLADGIATRLSRSDPIEPLEITQSFGAVVDLMRWAEQRLEQQTLAEAVDESSSVARQAAVETSLVLLTLILAVALAVVLARSLNQSLRRLREGALAVANRDLPDAVARLRDARNLGDGGADDIVRQVRDPIRLNNRDEVGQVAQAFNVVHREAVRIAAEQAALRTSVSAMFLNLARRSQSLVDRMIGELDQIERGEEDPKRLAQLFELDHLATRMRRNDENLLVLAGADSSAPRREDALVVDALRAAQSEVELYNRIEFGTVDTDISIMAVAVNDVVRLVAELLDNATRFSPPNTVVVADGRRIRDYVVIQVEDRGLGMSEEQMDSLNRRLAETPDVDVAAFRLMGLAVVSRLASRYGIRVELRANIEGGTVAQVVLPNHIVILPNSRSVDGPRGNRQLDPGPASWNDPMPLGRSSAATATLPAVSGEPWGQRSGGFPAITAQQPPHPQLPVPPSHLPGRGNDLPSPDRPALPKRGDAQPGERPPLPVRVPQPADPAPAYGAGSPTMAYPAVTTAAPDRGVQQDYAPATGFVTPDGARIPAPRRPSSPNPNGWGAALASMPPAPAPPVPALAGETGETSPIFLEMQQSWFKGHDGPITGEWSMPTAGYAPPPNQPQSPAAMAAPVSAPVSAPAAAPVSAPAAAPVSAPVAAAAPMAPPAPVAPPVSKPQNAGHNGSRSADAGSDNGAQTVPRPRRSAEEAWRTAADDGWQRAMAAAEPVVNDTTRSGLPKRVPQAQLVPGGVQDGPRNQNRRSPDEVRGLLSAYHRGVQRGRTAGSEETAVVNAPAPKENKQ